MRIVIDGDGSPVKDTTVMIANQFHLPVIIVTSVDHYTNKQFGPQVSFIYVDKGADMADYKIVGLIRADDVLITQDYGLASLVLNKGAAVFHHSGTAYTKETIDQLLEQRYFSAKLRKAGQRTKGPKAYTDDMRKTFEEALTTYLTATLKA